MSSDRDPVGRLAPRREADRTVGALDEEDDNEVDSEPDAAQLADSGMAMEVAAELAKVRDPLEPSDLFIDAEGASGGMPGASLALAASALSQKEQPPDFYDDAIGRSEAEAWWRRERSNRQAQAERAVRMALNRGRQKLSAKTEGSRRGEVKRRSKHRVAPHALVSAKSSRIETIRDADAASESSENDPYLPVNPYGGEKKHSSMKNMATSKLPEKRVKEAEAGQNTTQPVKESTQTSKEDETALEKESEYDAAPEDITITDGQGLVSEAAREAANKLEERGPTSAVLRLADGIGSLTYSRNPTGSRNLDRDFRERLFTQDIGVLVLLVIVFAITMCASCLSIYYLSEDPSAALFYSNVTRRHRLLCESDDTQEFLSTFNTPPQNVRLRLIGRHILPQGWGGVTRTLHRRLGLFRRRSPVDPEIAFDVSLDLTAFISSEGSVAGEEMVTLQTFIAAQNPLETLVLKKRAEWEGWEDVATNVRQRLRTLGFAGKTEVVFEADEELLVIRNHPLANFARSHAAKALVCISIIGGIFWWPFVWVRSKKVYIKTNFKICVDPERYWDLLGHGLHAVEGFRDH